MNGAPPKLSDLACVLSDTAESTTALYAQGCKSLTDVFPAIDCRGLRVMAEAAAAARLMRGKGRR